MVACQAVVSSSAIRVTIVTHNIHFLCKLFGLISQCPHVGLFLREFSCSQLLTVKLTRVVSLPSTPRTKKYSTVVGHIWYIPTFSVLWVFCLNIRATSLSAQAKGTVRRSFPISCPCLYMNSLHVTCAERTGLLITWVRYFGESHSVLSTLRTFGSVYRASK